MLPPRGVASPGGMLPPRGWCFLGVGVPGGDPPRTATAVGGTHPTGMHSCLIYLYMLSLCVIFMQKINFLKLCGISTIQLSLKNQIKSKSGYCFRKREGNCLMTNEKDYQSFCKVFGDSHHSIFLSRGEKVFCDAADIPLLDVG